MLEMYSFRSIRSCISRTQYTWVYCLYVRIHMYLGYLGPSVYEPRHDKTSKMAVRPAKTQISLGIAQSDQSLRCPHEEALGP